MAVAIEDLRDWITSLGDVAGTALAIDEGGLGIVQLDEHNCETGARYEIGGIPKPEASLICSLCKEEVPEGSIQAHLLQNHAKVAVAHMSWVEVRQHYEEKSE